MGTICHVRSSHSPRAVCKLPLRRCFCSNAELYVVEGHSSSTNATLMDERVINKFLIVVDDAQRQHVERCKAIDRGCPFIASSDQAIQSA